MLWGLQAPLPLCPGFTLALGCILGLPGHPTLDSLVQEAQTGPGSPRAVLLLLRRPSLPQKSADPSPMAAVPSCEMMAGACALLRSPSPADQHSCPLWWARGPASDCAPRWRFPCSHNAHSFNNGLCWNTRHLGGSHGVCQGLDRCPSFCCCALHPVWWVGPPTDSPVHRVSHSESEKRRRCVEASSSLGALLGLADG